MADANPGGAAGDTGNAGGGALLTGAAAGATGNAGTGGGAADWTAGLDAETTTWLGQKGYKAPGDVVKAYRAIEKTIGSDKLAIPGKDAKPEDWGPVWAKLGRPEKPDGYGFKKPEGAAWYSDDLAKSFAATAHKAGLTAQQAAAAHDWFVADQAKLIQQVETERAGRAAAGRAALEKEWGVEFKARLDFANRAIQNFPGLADELKAMDLQSAPSLARALARLGHAMTGEDPIKTGGTAGFGVITPATALADIQKIQGAARADPKHAFWDKSHPEHAGLVARMAELHKVAFSDAA